MLPSVTTVFCQGRSICWNLRRMEGAWALELLDGHARIVVDVILDEDQVQNLQTALGQLPRPGVPSA